METEAENNGSSQQPDLDKVLEKINEIAKASADGDYIYRGEPECYDKVSSSLYRLCCEYLHTEAVYFDIEGLQDTILEETKTYIGKIVDIDETDNIGLLAEIQHFGLETNLIGFTEDSLIALFFACDDPHEEDGRVILLKKLSDNYAIETPGRAINRFESQKSVFVASPTGFVEPDNVVTIPADLKFPILNYLEKYHRISIATLYNDQHEFIRRSASREFHKGLAYQREADESKTREEKDRYYKNAIRHYAEAIKLKPNFANAYNNRGNVYRSTGDFDAAIQDFNDAINLGPEKASFYNNRGSSYFRAGDFDAAIQDYSNSIRLDPKDAWSYNSRGVAYFRAGDFEAAVADFSKAIDLDPEDAEIYSNRGEAWLHLKEWQKVKADLTTAKDMGWDIIESFHNDYESFEDFEAKNEVKMPKDIAALLSDNTT